jgi:Domain of unknown function (DUF4390)
MMDFSTHFLKNKRHKFGFMYGFMFGKTLQSRIVLFAFCIFTGISPAYAAGPEGATAASISSIQVERADGTVFLNAQLKFDLPTPVEDVLLKGIPLIFVAEVEVRRERWYWYDKKLVVAARQMRLAYQPLTRRWRLNITNSTGSNGSLNGSAGSSGGALGGGLPQYFETLPEAMSKIQRISRWRIVDLVELDPDAMHTLDLSFKLDVSQMPRPFQIGLIGQSDWNISTAKSIRFPSEGIK